MIFRKTRRLIFFLTVGLLIVFGLPLSTAYGTVDINTPPVSSQYTNTIVYPGPVTFLGGEEIVYDWTTDQCETEDIPDTPANAFRDSEGNIQLIATHYINRRMLGSDLDSLVRDCNVIMTSSEDTDPSHFNNKEWLYSPYTLDGTTVYALVHNEQVAESWYNSLTLAVSTDSGSTYTQAVPPGQLVACSPYQYEPFIDPSGIFGGSNIIYNSDDGYYYAMIHLEERGLQQWGVGVMRTQDLSDPTSWRAWDGTGFNVQFVNPYLYPTIDPADHVCAPVSRDNIEKMCGSLTYNTYFDKYMLVGSTGKWDYGAGKIVYGFYYSLSDDLIHWSPRQLIMEGKPIYAEWLEGDVTDYPSLIDPDDTSRNFEYTDQSCYLYFTRWHDGTMYDRDLVRIPIQFNKLTVSSFTVNSTGDGADNNHSDGIAATAGGECTLRAAIEEANARTDNNTVIQINFNIPGTGPHVIQPASFLPEITKPVYIDGYTQPGTSPNTAGFGSPGNAVLKIELDGVNAGGSTALEITAGNCTVRGLAINRFGNGIWLEGSGSNVIEGNYLGSDSSGLVSRWGGRIQIQNSPNNIIGGTTPESRNVIANTLSINGTNAAYNYILGNYFGTDKTGLASIDDEGGISITGGAHHNNIGGVSEGNLISGLITNNAVLLDGAGPGNLIEGNIIGPDASGGNLGNTSAGVFIRGNSGGCIIRSNVIAYNSNAGVGMYSDAGTGHAVLTNSIYGNGLGLDFNGQCGAPSNDSGDADTGPNNWQNHPVISSVFSNGANTTFSGVMMSSPNTEFRIQFFSNDSCESCGAGKTYLGTYTVTTDGTGSTNFIVVLPVNIPAGRNITSTATDSGNNTSEFSPCIVSTANSLVTDLMLTKTDSPDPVYAGQPLTYTITVTNNGPDDATGVTVTDVLPVGVIYVSGSTSQGTITPLGNTVVCNLNSLADSTQAVINLTVQPVSGGTITNTAYVENIEGDPNTVDNIDTENTTVVGLTSIDITPQTASLLHNQTQQFTADGTFTDSSTQDITTIVTWSSGNINVASIGEHTGLATGIAGGECTITARFGGISDYATITVASSIVITTLGADKTGATATTLHGNLDSLGTAAMVDVFFEWSEAQGGPYIHETTPSSERFPGAYSFRLTGLSGNTTYYYRAKATGDGTAYGVEASFTTLTSGCFIATAAYGSYLDPHLDILRGFRDRYLVTNSPGQEFINFYYTNGPAAAQFINDHSWLKPVVRVALVPVVAMSALALKITLIGELVLIGFLILAAIVFLIWVRKRRKRNTA